MKLTTEMKSLLDKEVQKAVKETLTAKGIVVERPKKKPEDPKPSSLLEKVQRTAAKVLKEAFVLIPRTFLLKTEKLSDKTKAAHFLLYKDYIEAFNKLSIGLDAANTEEAKATTSAYRSLKIDEGHALNSIKLHELYFSNISDAASQISVDSLPFMRLARDWGTFEKWQYDFMACAMSARSGWAMTVFEPYRNTYMNIIVDEHNVNVPLGAIPVIVMDMWEHAYFKDYVTDRKSYLAAMMRELNWNVVEARMMVAERADINAVYQIVPMTNAVPDAMLTTAAENAGGQPPITDVAPAPGTLTQKPPTLTGRQGMLGPTTPPNPAMTPHGQRT